LTKYKQHTTINLQNYRYDIIAERAVQHLEKTKSKLTKIIIIIAIIVALIISFFAGAMTYQIVMNNRADAVFNLIADNDEIHYQLFIIDDEDEATRFLTEAIATHLNRNIGTVEVFFTMPDDFFIAR